jgi:catechol 2,3-dioxygenase-like lactoylglutathione lyase family enzyme
MKGLAGRPVLAILGTTDLDRALRFYSDILGLTLLGRDTFGCSLEAGGTELRLTLVRATAPPPYSQLGWRVIGLDDVVSRLEQSGVSIVRFDGLEQDDVGAWSAPDGRRVAWFRDPDGNLLSVVEDAQR